MRGASRPSSSVALTVPAVMAFAMGLAGVGGIALAGPTADPLAHDSVLAAQASSPGEPAASSVDEVADSFAAMPRSADHAELAPVEHASQPNLNVPEIPLPPILVPMAAGLIFVGRRIVAGRMPGPRLH